ncbi:CLIP-associating protein 2-like isoform X4 [Lethenteron reissneri]|uniref:CLIP-associating protein 2-like isoform X4 n=1 Tax=Lethenteron reissneri TaxID=7753 RepID=UPI002AB6B7DD|nr:CLIP-associating protein 2-like isoform X4 [Lethenteron reissneri]
MAIGQESGVEEEDDSVDGIQPGPAQAQALSQQGQVQAQAQGQAQGQAQAQVQAPGPLPPPKPHSRVPTAKRGPGLPVLLAQRPMPPPIPAKPASLAAACGPAREGAGSVDHEDFIRGFEDVPVVQIYSSRDLEDSLNIIRGTLSDDKHDWEKRIAALKKLRSLVIAGAPEYDCFFQHLRLLDSAFKLSAKDLRSQVVREACITLGHLATVLRNKFDHAAEAIIPTLFNLVPNCARIIATSGVAAIRLIIRHTHVPRLIPLITGNCTSKSVAVRRRCYEFLNLLLHEWQSHILERHVAVLVETIKKGIPDADAEARVEARRAYWGLYSHFPAEAEALHATLAFSYQKALLSEHGGGASSLNRSDHSTSSSQESLNRAPPAKSSVTPKIKGVVSRAYCRSTPLPPPLPVTLQRSRSDVDVNAAAGAKSRASGGNTKRLTVAASLAPGSTASLADSTEDDPGGHARSRHTAPESFFGLSSGGGGGTVAALSEVKDRSRAKGSQSQPGSRSGSPGKTLSVAPSPYGCLSLSPSSGAPLAVSPTQYKASRVPRSQGCSRETSPTRLSLARCGGGGGGGGGGGSGSRIPRPSVSQGCSRDSSRDTSPARGLPSLAPRHHSKSTSALAAAETYLCAERFGFVPPARLLGLDVEAAVASSLYLLRSQNSKGMSSDDEGDGDLSSAGSEPSGCSSRDMPPCQRARPPESVAALLSHCASADWVERKDGLRGLRALLASRRPLSQAELRRLCDTFTRMFADPHGKVFCVFLDTLVDFVSQCHSELHHWLYVLLTQLLSRACASLLGSVQAKVQRGLDITRDCFPFDQQFNIIMKCIVDQSQTAKMKLATMRYLEGLARRMDPEHFANSSETRHAVSRVITWSTEAKSSSETRKVAQAVLIALLELNTAEFTMLLGALPRTFQEGATRLLHSHLHALGASGAGGVLTVVSLNPALALASPTSSPTVSSHGTFSPSLMPDLEAESAPREDDESALRSVAEAARQLSYHVLEPASRLSRKESDAVSRDNGLAASLTDVRGPGSADRADSPSLVAAQPRAAPVVAAAAAATARGTATSGTAAALPTQDDATASAVNTTASAASSATSIATATGTVNGASPRDHARTTCATEPGDVADGSAALPDILRELSSGAEGGERQGERMRAALQDLWRLAHDGWLTDSGSTPLLLTLTDAVADPDHTVRMLALHVLREMALNRPESFASHVEVAVIRTLEAHRDPHKEVVHAAEEAAAALASALPPEPCLRLLWPFVQTATYPSNLAAIKMQTKVVERLPQDVLLSLLPDVVPGLVQGYDNAETSVRKASVFCLVAIYTVIGDELTPHLALLSSSKMKLLNLYIKRAQAGSSGESTADMPGQS